MRVTILPAENVIFIDGQGKALNGEFLNQRQVSIINWYDHHGEIKYVNGTSRTIGDIKRQQPDGWSLQNLIDMAKPFGGS